MGVSARRHEVRASGGIGRNTLLLLAEHVAARGAASGLVVLGSYRNDEVAGKRIGDCLRVIEQRSWATFMRLDALDRYRSLVSRYHSLCWLVRWPRISSELDDERAEHVGAELAVVAAQVAEAKRQRADPLAHGPLRETSEAQPQGLRAT